MEAFMFQKLLLTTVIFAYTTSTFAATSSIFSSPRECRVIAGRVTDKPGEACGQTPDCFAVATNYAHYCVTQDCECIILAQTYNVKKGLSKEEAEKKVKSDANELAAHCESQDAKAILLARMF